MMRLLALADERPPEDPAALAAANEVDAVLTLGDLAPADLVSLRELELPLIGVHGNHDGEHDLSRAGVRDLHLAREALGGWSFAGFEGCVRYRESVPYQYTQEEADRLVARLPPADVLACHCPPWGVNDEPGDPAHQGFRALRGWVERHEPAYLLHGHTTPDPRTRVHRLGGTDVIWVRGAQVVELKRRDGTN